MSQEPATPDSASEQAPVAETPAQHIAQVQKKQNLYRRVTASMPLLITVIVHVILIGIAGAVVVQQNIVGNSQNQQFVGIELVGVRVLEVSASATAG